MKYQVLFTLKNNEKIFKSVICRSHMKYQVLLSPKDNEKILKSVVCCNHD